MSRKPFPTLDRPGVQVGLPTRAMLIVLLAGASLAFSTAFACATPFAALATVAVLGLRPRDALMAVTFAWLVNQADGFLFMHYPQTVDSFGWGIAIWAAAIAATLAAFAVWRLVSDTSFVSRGVLVSAVLASCGAFAVAFAAYEGVLLAATSVLPSSAAAFSPAVVGPLLAVNGVAFVLLLASIGLLTFVGSWFERSTSNAPGATRKPAGAK